MDEYLRKLSEEKWKKNWSGPWLLLECYFFGDAYTRVIKEKYGVGFGVMAFVLEEGMGSNFYRVDEMKLFGTEFATRISKDISYAFDVDTQARSLADQILAYIELTKDVEIDRSHFEHLFALIYEFLPIMLAIKFAPNFFAPDVLEKLLPMLSELRVYSEPVYDESSRFVRRFASQIAQKKNLKPEHVMYFTRTELEAYFSDGTVPDERILQERYEGSVLIMTEGKPELYTGSAAHEFEQRIQNVTKSNEVIGVSAFKGTARGKVRIVFDPKNISHFDEPTVLVTGMTRPDYLHLFKEAVAIVTDAGGVLSHAAITARELKKPCVIGTEVATKVLKDGDMVEVDANTGVVKILESI